MPSIFSVSGNPVTTAGTLTTTLATQTAGTVFAGPSSGAASTPSFRSLVIDDIISALNVIYYASDTATTVNNGNTGVTSIYNPTPGKYWASFSADVQPCSGCTVLIRISQGAGSAATGAERVITSTARQAVASQVLLTHSGSTYFWVHWTSTPAGVSTMYARSFLAIRVGSYP